jgi:hypothetical protein
MDYCTLRKDKLWIIAYCKNSKMRLLTALKEEKNLFHNDFFSSFSLNKVRI